MSENNLQNTNLYKNRNFYVREEVEKHNSPSDAWITLSGYVYNITELLAENSHEPVTN